MYHAKKIACQSLGWPDVPTTTVATLTDTLSVLTAERDENLCRKDFTIVEAVRMCEAILAVEKPKAKERKAATQGRSKKGKEKTAEKFTAVSRSDRETASIAAKAVGMRRPTFEKAKMVIESGDAKLIAEIVPSMARQSHFLEKIRRIRGQFAAS